MDAHLVEKVVSTADRALIGISGFGGSGETTVATSLGNSLGIPVVSVDSFIKNRDLANYTMWSWIDYQRLQSEVLDPFLSGQTSLRYGLFNWEKNLIHSSRELRIFKKLIIEGVGLFRPALLKYFALTIWIDCPLQDATRRGKRRDREVYNNPQDDYWDGEWLRNDREFYALYRPDKIADYVFDNSRESAEPFARLNDASASDPGS